MARHIRRDDTVEVISGDDKGVRGRVLRVDTKKGVAIVEGVNQVYKHLRRSRRNPQGGRLEIEAPIRISNLLPLCPKCNRGRRVAIRADNGGKKHRRCAACDTDLGEL
jgi:large subunit ribosomal protein L24